MLCFSVSVFSSAQLLPTGLSSILNISFGNAVCSCRSVRKDYEMPGISFNVTEVNTVDCRGPFRVHSLYMSQKSITKDLNNWNFLTTFLLLSWQHTLINTLLLVLLIKFSIYFWVYHICSCLIWVRLLTGMCNIHLSF